MRRFAFHLVRRAYWLRARFLLYVFGWDAVGRVFRDCPQPHVAWLLRRFGAEIDPTAVLSSPLYLHNARDGYRNLRVGAGAHLGKRVFLDLTQPISLGERSTVSMGVTILTHVDAGRSRLGVGRLLPAAAPVEIGPDAYIGANATILHGVKIGEGAVVGAGALVREDVAPDETVAGVPAQPVRTT